jgi:hypothetical protein
LKAIQYTSEDISGVFLLIDPSLKWVFSEFLPKYSEIFVLSLQEDSLTEIWKRKALGEVIVLWSKECPREIMGSLDFSITPNGNLFFEEALRENWQKIKETWIYSGPKENWIQSLGEILFYKAKPKSKLWIINLFLVLLVVLVYIPKNIEKAAAIPEIAILESVKAKPNFSFQDVPKNQINRYLRRSLFDAQMQIPSSEELTRARKWVSENIEGKESSKTWDSLSLPLPPFIAQMPNREWKAYKYWLGLIEDSLTYPTDYWWDGPTGIHRKHEGIDLGGKMGARFSSPITGIALVGESKRAGRYIAVYNKDLLVMFAHCDKLFFQNKETIAAGDALGTIGLTGNTTGPHIHLGTGYIDKKGPNILQGIRHKLLNPTEFYWEVFKKTEVP